jgi:hypothetical protein
MSENQNILEVHVLFGHGVQLKFYATIETLVEIENELFNPLTTFYTLTFPHIECKLNKDFIQLWLVKEPLDVMGNPLSEEARSRVQECGVEFIELYPGRDQ